jgi:hypothetical protein
VPNQPHIYLSALVFYFALFLFGEMNAMEFPPTSLSIPTASYVVTPDLSFVDRPVHVSAAFCPVSFTTDCLLCRHVDVTKESLVGNEEFGYAKLFIGATSSQTYEQ